MIIQHNLPAEGANRQMAFNNTVVGKNIEKLSSGFKINRAGDDAAGLAISEKMRAQIKGLDKATDNAQDGISLIQTAEGALTEVHSMLNRMTELSTQSANGTYADKVDREAIQNEMNALVEEIDRISQSTNFNGINLIDGSLGGGKAGYSNGVNFTSAVTAKFDAASKAGLTLTTNISTTFGNKLGAASDTFVIDGEKLTIDWTKGDAKVLFDELKTTATMSADKAKDIASKLTTIFNDAAKEQGLKGSVKVESNGTNLQFKSNSKQYDSEFSYAGTSLDATTSDSLGGVLFGSLTGKTGTALTSVAKATYNNESIDAGSVFNMNINGKDVLITIGAITKGSTTMGGVASALQTAVRAAIAEYNTLIDSTNNTEKALTDTDFTVEANKEGGIVVKYGGDKEDLSFSFSDIEGLDKFTAQKLGLASGSSKSGGNQGLDLQVGDTNKEFNIVSVSVDDMSARGLNLQNLDVSTKDAAGRAQDLIKAAINTVSSNRGNLGALQNRLEHTINNLKVSSENMTAAESRIRDTDMAKEMMHFTKNNVVSQAAQAMLAQANQQPQGVLQLLR